MRSALYQGWVAHARHQPDTHAFRYRIGMLYLDLSEQDAVLGLSRLAGRSRWAPFGMRETDFLPALTRQGIPLIDAVRMRVALALGEAPQGHVCLLAQPRSWGLAFNPASFFYCHDADGLLAAILCEVTNTPWRERYQYVLPAYGDGESRQRVAKQFHVSPFLPRDAEYRMRFSPPDEELRIHMENWQGDTRLFNANLKLARVPLTRASLHQHLWQFPWMTASTLVGIYAQAFRLLRKRTPLHAHQDADGGLGTAHLEPRHEKPNA